MPTTGIDKLPYPNSGDIPDGPAAFLGLGQRLSLMKGAGIGYAADSTALAAMISNGDAFTGFFAYYAAADALVRYNGTAFKLWGVKQFVDVTAQGVWTASYSGLLESGSASLVVATKTDYRYSGSAWVFFWQPEKTGTITAAAGGTISSSDTSLIVRNGIALMQLGVSRTAATPAGTLIATLPAGFFPATRIGGCGVDNAGIPISILVNTNGNVNAYGVTATGTLVVSAYWVI